MFTATLVKSVSTLAMATALAGAVLFTSPASSAHAAGLDDASMQCGYGTGAVQFGLPLAGTRYSYFAYRLDGGAWRYTTWFFASNGSNQIYTTNGWQPLNDGAGPIVVVGGPHQVEGWEYRWTAATGGQWVALQPCTTSSFFGGNGGIVFN